MVMTYKELVKNRLETIIFEHSQLGESHYYYGYPYNLTEKDLNYFFCLLQPGKINLGENINKVNFKIYIMDLLDKEKNNLIDIQNDIILIFEDIKSELLARKEENYELWFNKSFDLIPFTEQFKDVVSGYYSDISIEVKSLNNSCLIPKNE
jgi:hypothetical protein